MRQRLARLAASLALLAALLTLPATSVLACSCVHAEPAERLAGSDVVFIGSVIEEREPEEPSAFAEAIYLFDVERSRQPIGSPYGVAVWFGGDANCGFDMTVGERWLVFATVEDGVPRTNLCQGTTPFPPADALMRRLVEAQVTNEPEPGSDDGAIDGKPGPIPGVGPVDDVAPVVDERPPAPPAALIASIGTVLLFVVSLFAFRRAR